MYANYIGTIPIECVNNRLESKCKVKAITI